MMQKFLKKREGIATSDAIIALLIFSLFTGLITTLSYNIYLKSTSVKRNSEANGYITKTFEEIEKQYYDDVTEEWILSFLNSNNDLNKMKVSTDENAQLSTPYKIFINVQKYNEIEGNEQKLDLIKEITMTVKYNVGKKNNSVTMSMVKRKENLVVPNKPDITLIETEEGQIAYPIKYLKEKWIVTTQQDSTWYNFDNGNWPIVILSNETYNIGKEIPINLSLYSKIYIWIPRYSYNENGLNNEIQFLYSNTNKYIHENILEDTTMTNSNLFIDNNLQIKGIWITEYNAHSMEVYNKLNNSIYRRINSF